MTTSAAQTEAVLGHHLQMLGSKDLDGIMSDYMESSVIIAPDKTYRGRGEIRALFNEMLPMATPEFLAAHNISKQEIIGDIAYIVWSADGFVALGTDTFVVKEGKIAVQTFALHPAG